MLRAAVCGVTKRAYQQRNMIVLRIIRDLKHNTNLRVETIVVEPGEIRICIEHETVCSCRERLLKQKERLDASLIVSPGMGQRGPALVMVLALKIDSHSVSGLAA